jgi:hypothetical protein
MDKKTKVIIEDEFFKALLIIPKLEIKEEKKEEKKDKLEVKNEKIEEKRKN